MRDSRRRHRLSISRYRRNRAVLSAAVRPSHSVDTAPKLTDATSARAPVNRAARFFGRSSRSRRERGLHALLSSDECTRATLFRSEHDRQRFIARRGLLRVVLASYAGVSPERLEFSYGPFGKPALVQVQETEAICFSASHSSEIAVYGVTHGHALGVDIERVRPVPEAETIAAHYFSLREHQALIALPPDQRNCAFFECWTCKEAYVKALGLGQGLSLESDRFDVSFGPSVSAALLQTPHDPNARRLWQLHALRVSPGYVAALVVQAQQCRVTCRRSPAHEPLRL